MEFESVAPAAPDRRIMPTFEEALRKVQENSEHALDDLVAAVKWEFSSKLRELGIEPRLRTSEEFRGMPDRPMVIFGPAFSLAHGTPKSPLEEAAFDISVYVLETTIMSMVNMIDKILSRARERYAPRTTRVVLIDALAVSLRDVGSCYVIGVKSRFSFETKE